MDLEVASISKMSFVAGSPQFLNVLMVDPCGFWVLATADPIHLVALACGDIGDVVGIMPSLGNDGLVQALYIVVGKPWGCASAIGVGV